MKRGHVAKAALTPLEKLRVAYFHEVRGVEQHVLADWTGVNPGRVAEAIVAVRKAIGLTQEGDGHDKPV